MLTRTRLSERLAAALLVMAAVTALGETPPVRAYAITDVTLIPMKTDGASPSQTVIVRDGRVAAIGPTSLIRAPTDSVVIHGAGLALLPGLADMHVHLRRQDLEAYLAHGITTVRNMWGHPGIRELQREIELGNVIGPHVYSTSPGVDGSPPSWPLTRLVDDPANAAAAVDALYAEGWRTIKLYNNLSSETYESIVGAARARGMDFAGHVPIAVDLEAALAAGQRSIEHMTGYDRSLSLSSGIAGWVNIDRSRLPELARRTREAGVWNCPTLVISAALAARRFSDREQQQIRANKRMFLIAMHDAGARLLAGSDAGIGVVAPGASLLDELEDWVAAGLAPADALRAATLDAAEFLGAVGEFGAIVPGARADLLLVDGNPLEDIGALRRIEGVMLQGRWLGRQPPVEAPER